jgi:hypothetical protein
MRVYIVGLPWQPPPPPNYDTERTDCFWVSEADSMMFKGIFFFSFFDENLGNRKYKEWNEIKFDCICPLIEAFMYYLL